MIEVELPDGSIAEFPDTMSLEQIQGIIYQHLTAGSSHPSAEEPSALETAARGAYQGATFGLGDEIMALGGTLAARGYDSLTGSGLYDDESFGQTYSNALQIAQTQEKAASQANPALSMASDFAGGLVTGKAAAKALKALGLVKLNKRAALATAAGAGAFQGYTRGEGDFTSPSRMATAAIGGAVGVAAPAVMDKVGGVIGSGVQRVKDTGLYKQVSKQLSPQSLKVAAIRESLKDAGGGIADDFDSLTKLGVDPEEALKRLVDDGAVEAQAYKKALSVASDDILGQFSSSIKEGFTPAEALRKARFAKFGVAASEGDITQDVIKQGAEDLALKGSYGPEASAVASRFREGQMQDIVSAGRKIAGRLGVSDGLADNEADVALDIIERVRNASASAKGARDAAYQVFRRKDAYIDPKPLQNLSKTIIKDYGEEFDLDAMAGVKSALQLINSKAALAAKDGQMSLSAAEVIRKRISNLPASNATEASFRTIMKRAYDAMIDDAVEDKLIYGADDAVAGIKKARAFHAAWASKFNTKEGAEKVIYDIVNKDQTPEQVMQKLISAGNLDGARGAGMVVNKLKDILGKDAPQIQRLKQAAFYRLLGDDFNGVLAGDLRRGIKGGTITNRINAFFRKNQTLANELYTAEEQDLIKEFGKVVADATVKQQGAINTSGTTPAAIRFMNAVLGKFGAPGEMLGGAALKGVEASKNAATQARLEKAFAGKLTRVKDIRPAEAPRLSDMLSAIIDGQVAGIIAGGTNEATNELIGKIQEESEAGS